MTAPAAFADQIEHRPECHATDPMTYLKRRTDGGARTKCRTCGRGVDHDDPMPRTDHESTPVQVPVSHYRCRDHPDVATTWRGTGCQLCTAELSTRTTRRDRRAARAARRAAIDEY